MPSKTHMQRITAKVTDLAQLPLLVRQYRENEEELQLLLALQRQSPARTPAGRAKRQRAIDARRHEREVVENSPPFAPVRTGIVVQSLIKERVAAEYIAELIEERGYAPEVTSLLAELDRVRAYTDNAAATPLEVVK